MKSSASSCSSAPSSSSSASASSSRRGRKPSRRTILGLTGLLCASAAQAQKAGTFEIVGNSGVSAQQLFLGTPTKVYILDKTENNPLKVVGALGTHPAWGTEYNLTSNTVRAMDVYSNSFCAGGTVLGNGTWINVGGNQGITWGGLTAASQTGGAPYDDYDGGKAIRFLTPDITDSGSVVNWLDSPSLYMTTRRWYPSLETLEDGTAIIIGGCEWGGYVNSANENNPTYEFYPSQGSPVTLNILTTTLPANLYPLTWLLPSGNLFIQTNWATEIFDYKNNVEYALDDIPLAVRTYPASGASGMFPLTPANNWTATLIFCGGTDLLADQWVTNWDIAAYPADSSCVRMTPDVSVNWVQDDSLDQGRSMGQFISLPDGRFWMGNGVHLGTAGYGNDTWAVGRSYGDQPILQSWYFDPSQASGSRWSKAGVSTVQRLYHSTATLLPDGSVLVSGSNPNPDYVDKTIDPTITYVTEYRTEHFYPDYYDKDRPQPDSLPTTLGYGGDYFDVNLPASSFSSLSDMNNTKIVVIRTGFSTHAINFGMRHVELSSTYTANNDSSATFHVSQLPPNPAILAPGPALIFVVVNGVPSQGQFVMCGSGKLGKQTVSTAESLPTTYIPPSLLATTNPSSSSTTAGASASATSTSKTKSAATRGTSSSNAIAIALSAMTVFVGALVL